MLGVMFARLYVSASEVAVTPRAHAANDSRRNPVSRESAVPTDITAVFFAKRASSAASSPGSGVIRSDVG